MLLSEIVMTSHAVGATRSRREKAAHLAAVLRRVLPDEAEAAVAFLSGELRQRQIGVGWAAMRELPRPAESAGLEVGEVDRAFEAIGALQGSGSQAARRSALADLLARATAQEQDWLRRLLSSDVRQGALAALVGEAAALAADVPLASLRRAAMLQGDLPAVAAAALAGGASVLAGFGLVVGRPVLPMLASPAADVAAALGRLRPAAVEWKLDGARIQVHRSGAEVRVFTRTLDEVTERVPEVVAAVLALPLEAAILDGEAITLRPDGRPEPFQVTASSFAARGGSSARSHRPLTALLFDVLHVDGHDMLDEPGAARAAMLEQLVPADLRVPRAVVEREEEAAEVLREALERGHEGVLVKSLEAPYEAGRRGAGWLKVKPRHTLDLVVLAAEWGHGRRRGTLSNLHLGARDPAGDGFVMLGKTFKGLTDAMLAWQTERLLALQVAAEGHVLHVRPELVVEIAFDGVQASTRYPGGVALRFARVVRHRPDKRAAEADDLAAVLATRARAD